MISFEHERLEAQVEFAGLDGPEHRVRFLLNGRPPARLITELLRGEEDNLVHRLTVRGLAMNLVEHHAHTFQRCIAAQHEVLLVVRVIKPNAVGERGLKSAERLHALCCPLFPVPREVILGHLVQRSGKRGVMFNKGLEVEGEAKEGRHELGGLGRVEGHECFLTLVTERVELIRALIPKEKNFLEAEPGLGELQVNIVLVAAVNNYF